MCASPPKSLFLGRPTIADQPTQEHGCNHETFTRPPTYLVVCPKWWLAPVTGFQKHVASSYGWSMLSQMDSAHDLELSQGLGLRVPKWSCQKLSHAWVAGMEGYNIGECSDCKCYRYNFNHGVRIAKNLTAFRSPPLISSLWPRQRCNYCKDVRTITCHSCVTTVLKLLTVPQC